MQGLRALYAHTGRRAGWQRLVEEIVPDFVADDDGPLPGREEQQDIITFYRVRLAMEFRDWAAAGRLQRACVEWNRHRAAPLLSRPPETLDEGEKNTLRTLATSLHNLGEIQREQGRPECVKVYEEAADFLHRIGDQPTEAVTAFSLGHAHTGDEVAALRDLEAAEGWYRRSLELRTEGDRLGRSKCLSQLGYVAWERFKEARHTPLPQAGEGQGPALNGAHRAQAEVVGAAEHLDAAASFYHQALALLPPDAVDDLAVGHHQLGNIYGDAGSLERSLEHYRNAAKFFEAAGDLYHAGVTRFNTAVTLFNAGRLSDALLYAQAALRNFEPYGAGAAQDIQDTQGLIAEIEQAIKKDAKGNTV
jgi:tetratricopeptide (TPR) repeat protein